MPLDEALIRRVLADSRIDDFDDSPIFRAEILNRVEAAGILVDVMWEGSPEIADRAKGMLCLFDAPALGPVAAGLARQGAQWRADLLDVVSTIIGVRDPRDWSALLGGVLPQIAPLLQDREMIDLKGTNKMEIEYEYRVCDRAYVCLQELRDPEYDAYGFLLMAFDERDIEIRALRSRLGLLTA